MIIKYGALFKIKTILYGKKEKNTLVSTTQFEGDNSF